MKDEKSKYILRWIQEISKIRPELGNFSICPYASGANFSIQEEKLCRIVPNSDFDVIIYIVEDNIDADTDATDILNADDGGSRYDNLMYHIDGEFMYFMIFLEADPAPNTYSYCFLMEDSANDGDYDYAVATYRDTGNSDFEVRVWSWNAGLEAWQYTKKYN